MKKKLERGGYGSLILNYLEDQHHTERAPKALPAEVFCFEDTCNYFLRKEQECWRLWLVARSATADGALYFHKSDLFERPGEAEVVGHYLTSVARLERSTDTLPGIDFNWN